jgi:hypothetical protein
MGRERGYDVFLSYARQDDEVAAKLHRALSQRGLQVFWDRELLPGEPWYPAIESALNNSRVLLFLLSDEALQKPWFRAEAAAALARAGRDNDVRVVPVIIPGWSGEHPMPYGLDHRVRLDLRDMERTDAAALQIEALIKAKAQSALELHHTLHKSTWLHLLFTAISTAATLLRVRKSSQHITPQTTKKLESLSPYQVASGVNDELMFFGRNEELTLLVGRRTSANYLLVGARQMGKTSLLKRIASKYPTVSRLITLKDGNLDDALVQSGLPPLSAFTQENTASRMLILLDEADLLIRADRESDYAVLRQLRFISADTGCRFVLAGFWELHRSARMEHHSPIKNFAEVLELGPLDEVSSRRLATEPLATIGVTYAASALVDELLALTGRRPNLIAIICHTFLKLLDPAKPVVTKAVLRAATDTGEESGQDLKHAFADLGSLSEDKERCTVDQMVLFSTFRKTGFSAEDVRRWLKRAGASIPMAELNESLQRLQLAYVLRQKAGRFDFAVPVIRDYLSHQTDDAEDMVTMLAHDWKERAQKS